MGQEVKNPLRAQSKYGLMGSSAKTGKKFFRGSPEHFLDKNAIWDRTPPPPTYTSIAVYMYGEGSRVPNLQTEFNYLDSFKSYGIFSDFVVPTWSPLSSRRPHIVPVILRRSPCGLHGLWSPHVVPTLSPSSPEGPHVVSMVCGLYIYDLHCPHIVPTSSLSSPHHLEGPHIIPNPQDTHSTHHPPPGGVGPRISKNAIRFELIKIF